MKYETFTNVSITFYALAWKLHRFIWTKRSVFGRWSESSWVDGKIFRWNWRRGETVGRRIWSVRTTNLETSQWVEKKTSCTRDEVNSIDFSKLFSIDGATVPIVWFDFIHDSILFQTHERTDEWCTKLGRKTCEKWQIKLQAKFRIRWKFVLSMEFGSWNVSKCQRSLQVSLVCFVLIQIDINNFSLTGRGTMKWNHMISLLSRKDLSRVDNFLRWYGNPVKSLELAWDAQKVANRLSFVLIIHVVMFSASLCWMWRKPTDTCRLHQSIISGNG